FFTLFHAPGGVGQDGINVFGFEIRISLENALARMASGQKAQDGPHCHAQTANAGLSTHHGGIMSDSRDLHPKSPPVSIATWKAVTLTPAPESSSGGRNLRRCGMPGMV